jgi:protein-disulfide isomerase
MTQVKVFLTGVSVAIAMMLLVAAPASADGHIAPDDMSIGAADAPLTIIEYASMTCSHCARFHTENLKKLKKEYIDTGKVRLVFREFPLDGMALRASMLARCAGEKRYFGLVDVMFRQQSKWASAEDPVAALGKLARLAGMSAQEIDACLADEKLMDRILQIRLDGNKKHDVNSTPSFLIGGTTYPGDREWSDWEDLLAKHLK